MFEGGGEEGAEERSRHHDCLSLSSKLEMVVAGKEEAVRWATEVFGVLDSKTLRLGI